MRNLDKKMDEIHRSEEHKQKMSKAMTKYPFGWGFCHNCGRELSDKELHSFSAWCSVDCFNIRPVKGWKMIYCRNNACKKLLLRHNNATTKYCSDKCRYLCEDYRQKRSEAWSGENNPNWKDGISLLYGPNWHEQRTKCRIRDNNICQFCSKTKDEHIYENDFGESTPQNMHVHHIIFFREFGEEHYIEANKLLNLICLCSSCHSKADGSRFYETYKGFLQLIAIHNTEEFLSKGPLLESIEIVK